MESGNQTGDKPASDNMKAERKVLNISLLGSFAFLVAEILCAIATSSKAILMDCIYDIADVVMIGPFLILVPLLYKPVTEKRPYGFSQMESLFVLIKYILMLFVNLILVADCIRTLLDKGNDVEATAIAGFELAVSVSCVLMYILLSRLGKKYNSPSIQAELYIWKLDSMSTLGVGLAFVLSFVIQHTSLAFITPYIDPVIAIVVAVLLAKEPMHTICDSLRNLLLFAPEKEVFDKVDKICKERLEPDNYTVTFTDVIKTGRTIWVQVYFSRLEEIIDVSRLKSAHQDIKTKLIDEFENVGLELIPDMDGGYRQIIPDAQPVRRKEKIKYIENMEARKANKKAKDISKV